jgi:hypothetical protein
VTLLDTSQKLHAHLTGSNDKEDSKQAKRGNIIGVA